MEIEPVTREERFLAAAGGRSVTPPTPITRKEQLLQGIIDAVKSGGGNGSGENVTRMEPAEDDIPCVYLYTGGAGMPFTKDEGERQVRMVYESRTKSEEYYLTAKVQGSSSASNPNYKKRNWTFKFYTDNTYEKKLKLRLKGWPEMNKFVLKAGWVIPGHLRNVGAAKIWGQIMKTRSDFDALPEDLRNSPNLGATDGFHVRVFIDGAYWGIYDWIVAKDQLFGQDKDNTAHSILNSELNNQPTCAFATTTPTIGGNWSEELQDSMTADTKTSMENWIKFVAGSTDEEFVANADNYFDVQSVIDAICFDRIMLTVDNMCRNQIVFKYDKKWYMGKWDLDAILGLPPVAGQTWYSYDTPYQEGYVAYKDYGIINMLYKRTEELFLERFKARYWELRNGPLSENNLNRTFGKLSDRLRSIEGLLAEENANTTGNGQFTGMPNVGQDTIQQIREFVVHRCEYMDGIVEKMSGEDDSGGGDTPESTNILSGTAFEYGSVNGDTGAPITSTVDVITGYVDVAPYIGKVLHMSAYGNIASSAPTQKIAFFDAAMTFVSCTYTMERDVSATVPNNAVYARFGTKSTALGISVYCDWESKIVNVFSADGATVGSYYDPLNGQLKEYAEYSRKEMTPDLPAYCFSGIVAGAFFDADDAFIEGIAHDSAAKIRIVTVPENAARVSYHWFTANQDSVVVDDPTDAIIGTLENTLS